MKSSFHILNGDRFVIVKHSGEIDVRAFHDFTALLDQDLGDRTPESLNDISELNVKGLSYDQIADTFSSLEIYKERIKGLRMALYTGPMAVEDLLKVSTYSKHEIKLEMYIRIFDNLDEAMDWLEMENGERQEALDWLSKEGEH